LEDSKGRESREELLSKREIVERLRGRLVELEDEIRLVKSLLALLDEEPSKPKAHEKAIDVKLGRKKVATLFVGPDNSYLRLVPEGEPPLASDVLAYLERLVAELRNRQKTLNPLEDEENLISLEIKQGPRGGVREIVVSGIRDTREYVRVRAALEYVGQALAELSGK